MKTVFFAFLLIFSSSVLATTYYIDYDQGQDTYSGLSKTLPWKRVPGMNGFSGTHSHSAGDSFIFKGGVTWPSAVYPWSISQGGSSSRHDIYTTDHSWFSGAGFAQPVFDDNHLLTPGGMIQVSQTGYICFNDLFITNYGTSQQANTGKALVFSNTHNITITNCTFTAECWITIYFVFDDGTSHSNFTWTGNDFSHTSGAIWFASAQAGTSMHDVNYNNNTFHDYASQIGGGVHGDGAWHYYSVPSSDGSQFVDGVTFCNNRFYGDFARSFGTDGAMTAFFFTEGSFSGTICNNDMSFSPVVAGMFMGLIVASGNNNPHSMSLGIYNNSLANIGTNAMSAGFYSTRVSNITLKNNIISGMIFPVNVEDANPIFTSDYNLFNGTSDQLVFGTAFQNYAQWQAAGRDLHGLLGVDPAWVAVPGDEHLKSTSPAIKSGANLTSLGIGELNKDINGNPRPASGAWDMGAYAYTGNPDIQIMAQKNNGKDFVHAYFNHLSFIKTTGAVVYSLAGKKVSVNSMKENGIYFVRSAQNPKLQKMLIVN